MRTSSPEMKNVKCRAGDTQHKEREEETRVLFPFLHWYWETQRKLAILVVASTQKEKDMCFQLVCRGGKNMGLGL